MNVHITQAGAQLALLEGMHAEEARIIAMLQPCLDAKINEAIAIARRIDLAHLRKNGIERDISAILNDRMAA